MRDTIKDSVRVAHPSMPEAEIDGLKITVHDPRNFACSYSRKYFQGSGKALAKLVGTKSFNSLDKYIRQVPRVYAPFQVPLGTITPNIRACHRLRKV